MYLLNKENLEKIKESGEGITYLIKDENNKVFKKYKAGKLTREKEDKLDFMEKLDISYPGICFPESIVRDNKDKFVGYIMPKAFGKNLEVVLRNQFKRFPKWTRINLVNLTLNILEKIDFLHKNQIIIGDLKPDNIMLEKDVSVYFVDTDSYQIDKFSCPVGTDEYTAPEILGKNFQSFLRTSDHDYFAVAVLLFKILVPGQHPYAHQGGASPAENIKEGNFSYPFEDEANFKAPKGFWEIIWNDFPYEIKKAFHSTFKDSKRKPPEEWIGLMKDYKVKIVNGICTPEIFPESYEKVLDRTVSTNFNRKAKGFGEEKTVLNSDLESDKFAVLELSTKAVKLLFAKDVEYLKNGFHFNHFFRKGILTNTGRGLNHENYMDMEFFRNKVCSQIDEVLSLVKKYNIKVLYTIATAAYRGAKNNKEILTFLKDNYNLNVKILSKEEEAQATLDAFVFSGSRYLSRMSQNILLIDQGGGSTEISVFSNKTLLETYSLNLGTTALKNIVFINSNRNTPLPQAFKNADKTVYNRLYKYFKNHRPDQDVLGANCVSVGSSITKATVKKGNKQQHGIILYHKKINDKIRSSERNLIQKYNNISELYQDIESDDKKIRNPAEHLFLLRLGLPMYLQIMNKFNIQNIVVSGTGLWYGVYYKKYLEYIRNCS